MRNPDRPGDGDDETDQTVSKEEEERYRKLQQENEQLQQLIAAREQKIKLLNQRLLERNTNTATSANGLPANQPSTTASAATAAVAATMPSTTTTPTMGGTARTAVTTNTIQLPTLKKNR